jgi:serine/threonine-protein kinase HipA
MARWSTVQVCLDLESFEEPLPMGSLHRQSGRGQNIFSFEYEQSWLEHEEAFAFDPDLALSPGLQYPAFGRSNFGIFLDSSPDRWGRVLMQRRENTHARREGAGLAP